jgi:hypothetical protein
VMTIYAISLVVWSAVLKNAGAKFSTVAGKLLIRQSFLPLLNFLCWLPALLKDFFNVPFDGPIYVFIMLTPLQGTLHAFFFLWSNPNMRPSLLKRFFQSCHLWCNRTQFVAFCDLCCCCCCSHKSTKLGENQREAPFFLVNLDSAVPSLIRPETGDEDDSFYDYRVCGDADMQTKIEPSHFSDSMHPSTQRKGQVDSIFSQSRLPSDHMSASNADYPWKWEGYNVDEYGDFGVDNDTDAINLSELDESSTDT